MKPTERARLTAGLREQVAKIAADLRGKMRAPGAARERAQKLHADEKVAEDFDVWTDLLSRRAAVLWVLKSVYLRVLEDRGLLSPGRLLDPEAQQLFERLAPHLGETAFLRWVYRDLASARGGLPELFSPQPAEVALPSDELSRALIRFWRERDADTDACWSFADEHFEGELMGDLYQELDPVVKDRFALCQTPDFVRAFILDRTLTPAIETFGADQVRLLDPACGSGHFLIDGLKRIVAATAALHPDWERETLVTQCLDRVVGIDLNDYACGLARARLIMTAAELAGKATLSEAAHFHPHVYWADGLEQVERDEVKKPVQTDLFEKTPEEKPRAVLTRSDVRMALRKVLVKTFHAVVANPPYILERDEARKEYHRELIGKNRRYVSATGKYSLASPFTERSFQLAEQDGFVGLITSNNFMKREFGKPLIEKVLARLDVTLVVDTSQAYIPFHGTPTVLIFGRNREPVGDCVRAVMGKRGESGTPEDPACGRVWLSIAEGWDKPGFETEYVSVADLPRATFAVHPWSLGGGGAADLKARLESRKSSRLGETCTDIGPSSFPGVDDVFLLPESSMRRMGVPDAFIKPFCPGDSLRDWAYHHGPWAIAPYDREFSAVAESDLGHSRVHFWRYRTTVRANIGFGGKTRGESGEPHWTWYRWIPSRFRTPLSIAFAFVATHNHFVLDRGGKVFKQSAPVIKLPAGATEDDHLALLGLLNSSTACFWMKQVFHCKGSQGINEGMKSAFWEQFFEFDATKIKLFPIIKDGEKARPYAAALDRLARLRADNSVAAVLRDHAKWSTAEVLKQALSERRTQDRQALYQMVALQEELDWLAYGLYGLDDSRDSVAADGIEPAPPTWLPWCLNFAARDAEIRSELAQGQNPGELPTVWFERHRWQPVTELPAEASPALRARIEARRQRIREVPALALIETANFKRRWYCPDYEAEEKGAMQAWLADQVEVAAKGRTAAFSLDQIVAALQDDPHVLAVCELLAGRRDFSPSQLVAEVLAGESVPNHRFHIYKPGGLVKRAAWERTWEDQRREDAGEKVTPEVPPSYGSGDFLKSEYWQLRGKLDVPKERFIAFTEVPGRGGIETLYGWAGWTPIERLRAMLAMDEQLEDADLPVADRIGLLDSAWRLLPDVARDDAAAAGRLKAELQSLVGPNGPSPELVEDWRKRFPPPKGGKGKAQGTPKSRKKDVESEESDE